MNDRDLEDTREPEDFEEFLHHRNHEKESEFDTLEEREIAKMGGKPDRWSELHKRITKDFSDNNWEKRITHAEAWAAYIADKEARIDALQKQMEILENGNRGLKKLIDSWAPFMASHGMLPTELK